jgi:hypothetical protein
MRIRTVFAALAGITAVGLAGCGILQPKTAQTSAPPPTPAAASQSPSASASPSADAAISVDVCTLLTLAEVSALSGIKVAKTVPGTGADPSGEQRSCQWRRSDDRPVLDLTVFKLSRSDFEERQDKYDIVRGVGDLAYRNQWVLSVLLGDTNLDVALVDNGTGEDSPGPQRKIALKVLPKLSSVTPTPTS